MKPYEKRLLKVFPAMLRRISQLSGNYRRQRHLDESWNAPWLEGV